MSDTNGMDKRTEIAFNRFQLIAPLICNNEPEDARELRALAQLIAIQSGVSVKTIFRYVQNYTDQHLEGLLPKRTGRPGARVLSDEIVLYAAQLRKENPKRGLRNISRCAEIKFDLEKGSIKRSTLNDRLDKMGLSKSNLAIETGLSGPGGRRFQRADMNALWQSDFKHGIYINGKKTYLISFFDDATRVITHSEFSFSESTDTVLRCFRKGIEKFGKPEAVYFDNGTPFRSHALLRTVSVLGIQKKHCKPYSSQSKGKVEKFHQIVDKFLAEVDLQHVYSLEDLNYHWSNFLNTFYMEMGHSALDGLTPLEAVKQSNVKPCFVDKAVLDNAFLHVVTGRRVDNSGCVNFKGKKYFTNDLSAFIGQKVDIVFDPILNKVWIVPLNGIKMEAMELVIKEFLSPKKQKKHLNLVDKNTKSEILAAAEINCQKNATAREHLFGLNADNSVSSERPASQTENVEITSQPSTSEIQRDQSGLVNDVDSRVERKKLLINFNGLNQANADSKTPATANVKESKTQVISFRSCLKSEGDS